MVTDGILVLVLTRAACSALCHPMTSLGISPGLSLSWEGVWAVLSMAGMQPQDLLLHSPLLSAAPATCIAQRSRSLKALKSHRGFKISGSTAPHLIWQLASPGVAAFQEIGLCV